MSGWQHIHILALRRHIEFNGFSASQAAGALNEEFRTAYSRNAVISKIKREGIRMSPGNGGGRLGPKGGPSQRKPRVKTGPAPRRKAASAPKAPAVPFTPRPDPRPGQVPLLELAADGCKWPSGDPALFCNEAQHPGFPYCADHCCLAYRERS